MLALFTLSGAEGSEAEGAGEESLCGFLCEGVPMTSDQSYYFYVMASASRVLYAGVTNHIERRVWEHKQKVIKGFSQRYNTVELVYFETHGDIRAAIRREKQVKGWLRAKNIALIASANPGWKDLSASWFAGWASSPSRTVLS